MSKPNLRQLVGFAILMQQNDGILNRHPCYVYEKFLDCCRTGIPESLLDRPNMAIMAEYAERWGMDWQPERDYNEVPKGAFDERGEPTAFIIRNKEEK